MSATADTERTRTKPKNGLVLADAPFDEAVAYLVDTYDLHPQEAREKVLIAKGMKTRQSRIMDE